MKAQERNLFIFFTVALTMITLFCSLTTNAQTSPNQAEKRAAIKRLNAEALGLFAQATPDSLHAALEKFLVVQNFYLEIGEKRPAASAFIVMGRISHQLGEYADALEHLNRAVSLWQEIGDQKWETMTLISLGYVYKSLGNDEKFLDINQRVLKLSRATGNKIGEAQALGSIGDTYLDRREYSKSLENYRQALSLYQEVGAGQSEMATLGDIGITHFLLRERAPALEYMQKALLLSRSLGDKGFEGQWLAYIGLVYLNLDGEKTKALENFQQALVLIRGKGNKQSEASLLSLLQNFWQKNNNTRLAVFYGKQSVNKLQELRQGIQTLDKKTQKTFLSSVAHTYRKLAELLIKEGRLPEAQAVLNLLKEEEYEQLARSGEKSDTVPYSQVEADVIAKIENLVALGRERAELQKLKTLTAEQEAKLEQLRFDITSANKAFDTALDALGKSESSAAARVDEIKNGQELQSALQLLGKETKSGVVALYTVLGAQDEKEAGGDKIKNDKTANVKSKFGWVIMVTEKGYKAYPIDTSSLEEKVFQFRNALLSDKYNPQPLAEKIYTAIFRQTSDKQKRTLETDLRDYLKSHKDKTIMWSLDGVLRYIPMAALHDGKQYLVKNYRNVIFTKQSFLWLTKENQTNWKVLGLGVSEKRENFNALPGVKTELETIVREPNKLTGILNGSIKLNDNFKKQTFFNSVENSSFPVVHIASHYSFNPTQQDASFLLVGDGHLTFGNMKEEKNLFGSVDLLTLSACDTGVSGNGKEAEGFAYLAQSLGAKSVIASLWQVLDVGTPELMIHFYKLLKSNPQMSKGEAFRQAQLELLGVETKSTNSKSFARNEEIVGQSGENTKLPFYVKDNKKPFAHPHYWSSFVLIGNWR